MLRLIALALALLPVSLEAQCEVWVSPPGADGQVSEDYLRWWTNRTPGGDVVAYTSARYPALVTCAPGSIRRYGGRDCVDPRSIDPADPGAIRSIFQGRGLQRWFSVAEWAYRVQAPSSSWVSRGSLDQVARLRIRESGPHRIEWSVRNPAVGVVLSGAGVVDLECEAKPGFSDGWESGGFGVWSRVIGMLR